MGIFGNNYNQKGSGLTKEEAAQRNYFDMVSRHFMDFMKVNLLFFGCIFVFILASALLAWPYLFNLGEFVDAVMLNKNYMLPILPFIPFMFIGPFVAGLTYVLRNWARQEHVFIVSDFFEHTKKNWKQGLALSVLNTFLTYALPTAALFYLKSGVSELLVLVAFVIVSVILIIMNFYTYTM
ncbi:MAG: YesL family protein, partial [Clostridia bacterium]|nr:YesL family protein [Clostridia bacterium]